jgi:hypothetical protein
MTIRTLVFGAIALFLTISGGAIALTEAAPMADDKIEYDTVYECGGMKSKFKVLSCKGRGRFDRCEVFYINELSPGGGHKLSTYRSGIETDIAQGCKTKSGRGYKTKNETKPAENLPVKNQNSHGVACFTSDSESDVKNTNEKNFRGAIRLLWEKKAPAGSDGTVTLAYETFVVGSSRPWRPTLTDAYSQADPKKPIFAVRTTFETCTDYRAAISKRKMERVYDCFVHRAGGWQCTQTGASGALALKDKKEYIQKKR